jgi:hypothetical protein
MKGIERQNLVETLKRTVRIPDFPWHIPRWKYAEAHDSFWEITVSKSARAPEYSPIVTSAMPR